VDQSETNKTESCVARRDLATSSSLSMTMLIANNSGLSTNSVLTIIQLLQTCCVGAMMLHSIQNKQQIASQRDSTFSDR